MPSFPKPLRAGFTLLELLAVLLVVGLLAGMVIGVGQRAAERGRVARAQAELAVLGAALEAYRLSYGDFPRTDDAVQLLRALLGRRGPDSERMVAGRPLLEAARFTMVGEVLLDPWGRAYCYAYKSPAGGWTNPGYVLYSAGPDGTQISRLLAGGFPDASAAANLDNIHANRN